MVTDADRRGIEALCNGTMTDSEISRRTGWDKNTVQRVRTAFGALPKYHHQQSSAMERRRQHIAAQQDAKARRESEHASDPRVKLFRREKERAMKRKAKRDQPMWDAMRQEYAEATEVPQGRPSKNGVRRGRGISVDRGTARELWT